MDPLLTARHWKEKNPEAWEKIIEWARMDLAHGQVSSMALFFELLRRPHFSRLLGYRDPFSPVRLPNALRADLARLVMEEHPRMRFRTAKVKADQW